MTSNITAPQPLTGMHEVSSFDCGETTLNEWIKRRALKNEGQGASRTYVICEGEVVIGYYALAVGGVAHKEAPSAIKRNMPDPIPVMILGRLAVDQNYRNKQLGSSLLRDALLRTLQVSQTAGIKAVMVEAISDKAKSFYKKHGFRDSPIEERLLFITIAEVEKCL
jgi:GNAT superfamily N-acetyltransferase